jgi:hypothetical protein
LAGSLGRAEELSGVILTDDGTPAAGATISAAGVFHKPPLRLKAVADDKGAFKIDLPRLEGDERYALAVRWQRQGATTYEGLDSQGKTVSLQGQKLPPQVARLRPGGSLRGRLLRAEDDGPIAGAKLFLDTGEVLVTDNEGAFALDGLEMDAHELIPVAPGRVRQYVLFDTSLEPEAQLEVRLPRGAVIKGRITDEAGEAIKGAYLTRWSSGTGLTLNGWDEACAGDGTFEYGGLSAERLFYSLQAEAPGCEPQSVSAEVDDPTAVIERDIKLKKKVPKRATAPSAEKPDEPAASANARTTELPRRTITGVVTGPLGEKIVAAKVRWGTFQFDSSVESAMTDAEGKYTLANVPRANGAVFVVALGYAPQFAPAKADQHELDVRLLHGTTVRGIVKNAAGRGVEGVQVIMLTQCMETGYCNPIWIDERSARTDEKGMFEIAALPFQNLKFDILKNGYSERRGVTLVPGQTNEITLSAGGAVRGRVVDAAGKPVRNFKVRVMVPRDFKPDENVGGYYAGFDWYGVLFTRADGVFVMSGMPASYWLRLVVSSPGVGRAIVERVQSGPLDALRPADDLTIKLVPYRPLVVRVVEASTEKPLVGASVSLLEDELFPRGFSWGYHDLWAVRRKSDAEGIARFESPNCVDGTLIVRAPGLARQRVAWTDGAAEIRAALDPGAMLQGEVHSGGRRLADGWARLATAKGESISANLAEGDGRFEFDQLPAGDYTLSITGDGGQPLESREITLEAGKARAEKFDLPADAGK